MKKGIVMTAAIALAAVAVPFGASSLSTVAVASENNTVSAATGNNTVSGTIAVSGTTAFENYVGNVGSEITDAKDGETVKITRDKNINALPNSLMKDLYEKKTVSLELEYTFEGKEYTVTIPAGAAENNDIPWYGPLYLQMRYGK